MEIWTLRKLERKYLESFEMWLLEEKKKKIKRSEKVTNKQGLERIGEKRIPVSK